MVIAGSPLRIELTSTPSANATDKLFRLSPSVNGDVRWVSPTIVEFVPEQGQMKPGRSYKVDFALDKLFEINDQTLKTFRFDINTAVRKARINTGGVTIKEDDPTCASVRGKILLSEPAAYEDVKKMLSIKYPSDGHSITIEGEGTTYSFTIDNLKTGSQDRELDIRFDGTAAGFSSESDLHLVIPGNEVFKILEARLEDKEDPYIEVRFSEPLDSSSDYNGFLTIAGTDRQHIDIEDNVAKVYFEKTGKEWSITISADLKGISSRSLSEDHTYTFTESSLKPAVETPLKGTILPDASALVVPFRSVNLSAVDISIIRIYEDNVLMFLQDNSLSSGMQIRRSGRLAYKKTIRLDSDRDKDLGEWQDFSIDLSGVIKHEPGAIYRIRLSFKEEYSLYGKDMGSYSSGTHLLYLEEDEAEDDEMTIWDDPYPYWYNNTYDWDRYDWNDRDDPLTPSYYMVPERFPEFNLLSSNIGIIAKSSEDGKIWVNINDILTTRPMDGVKVTAYNFQLQSIGSGKTDKEGGVQIDVKGKPFALVAQKDKTKSYLKVTDGTENSLSRFDTGGRKLDKGLKAFIYGERGIWRPGDTLHLTLIAEDRDKRLPQNHPVSVEIYTPQGQFYSRNICNKSCNGFYRFDIATSANDPTGTWNAYFSIGGATFHKSLPIETIKPNRLKISTDIDAGILEGGRPARARISSSWLTGPAASGLKATMEMSLRPDTKTFKGYEDYIFRNSPTDFSSESRQIMDVKLDAQGKAESTINMPAAGNAPGMLLADIVTKVTEPGGDVSIISQSMPFSPFGAYVGIRMPHTESWYETDMEHEFLIATVDMNGRRKKGHHIQYTIYRLGWNWWWDNTGGSIGSYVNSSNAEVYKSGEYISSDRDESIRMKIDYPDWGRFCLYVKDIDSGHSCGTIFTIDWPLWKGRSDKADPEALTMLTFTTDKKEYEVGEEATVYIPAAKNGRALVSIENGRTVISRTWVETDDKEDIAYSFPITEEMSPNFYIHISLLQPHNQAANDLPIRLYGVQPVSVSNEESLLEPVIDMPEVIRPQESFKIGIKEKDGKPMTYTLAVIDEGLLDITGFKTPDPWAWMYAREALGIKTWDLYNDVAGAIGGRFPQMFSIGGDEHSIQGGKRDNRFNPVIKFLGPFECDGQTRHTITLPMYVGSVRVMVIAGQDGAYGKAEKTVPVRSPLMILPTAPRVLGTGETVSIPVNVFALEENVKDVSISISTAGPAEIISRKTEKLHFNKTGDKLARFSIKAKDEGMVSITISAEGNGFKASETIHIESRNPAPGRLSIKRMIIEGGGQANIKWNENQGVTCEWARIGASGFPSVDFSSLFSYVSDYNHNCTEQICSRGLILLNIWDMLNDEDKAEAAAMIDHLLQQLYSRQLPDGGFCYWPGNYNPNSWISSMAGHFMTEASTKGHLVSKVVYDNWKKYQKNTVKEYRNSGRYDNTDLDQSYRLYTLALAGIPDNGAMNRLKEGRNSSDKARWMLASAYAICGKKNIALGIMTGVSTDISNCPEYDRTYGSEVRDKAIALEAFVLAGDIAEAMDIAEDIASQIDRQGFTTQTGAFAAIAMNRLRQNIGSKSIDIEIVQEQSIKVKSAKASDSWDLDPGYGSVSVINSSDEPIYIAVSSYGRPSYDTIMPAEASGLELKIDYRDLSGSGIDIDTITQGTEFIAEISVTNSSQTESYRDLALTMPIPSGWEILNERLYGSKAPSNEPAYSYNDIRDDRISYYFDLPKGQRKTFRIRMTAAYEGEYILPSVKCEAMYDNTVFAYSRSGHTTVHR